MESCLLYFATPMIWNSPTKHIHNSSSSTVFWKQFKTHLFSIKIICTANDIWFTWIFNGIDFYYCLTQNSGLWCWVQTITSIMLLSWDKNVLSYCIDTNCMFLFYITEVYNIVLSSWTSNTGQEVKLVWVALHLHRMPTEIDEKDFVS